MRTFGLCNLILCLGTINLCAGSEGIGPAKNPCDPHSGFSPSFQSRCCNSQRQLKSGCSYNPPKSVNRMA
ncbi:hypothetical protein PGT21_008441 [Puccinia graminis f. sp. tritici]|uniref:Uncharacterized protein n=1 Tax=Puccinia graminis f. sp. tritici TaxID=56615 RepID=A0A5B0MEU6_PUCGR|nr:hypothetical protein PGT21_008441 [Puccinia graminis f. sp. tritici]